VQPFFSRSLFISFDKEDGGIRPVACGDTIRRIAGKVLANSVKEKVKDLFYPYSLASLRP
jgi:hypothetical protein